MANLSQSIVSAVLDFDVIILSLLIVRQRLNLIELMQQNMKGFKVLMGWCICCIILDIRMTSLIALLIEYILDTIL